MNKTIKFFEIKWKRKRSKIEMKILFYLDRFHGRLDEQTSPLFREMLGFELLKSFSTYVVHRFKKKAALIARFEICC